jgi:1,4-alpha-glucan branching enzyme
MIFMGGELGQWNEWNPARGLDWNLLAYDSHQKLQHLVAELNHLHRAEHAFHEVDFEYTGFEWIDFRDADHSVVSFLRKGKTPGDYLVVVCNFTPVPHQGYRAGVPEACFHREIMNTDDAKFGGSGVTNGTGRQGIPLAWHNQPCYVELTLPPLGVLYLKPERPTSL